MITPRQRAILNALVGEYISSALPVPSQSIARRRELGLSPATVRNEMAELEEGGYIRRPHISAGGIPSDKGYRQYLAAIPPDPRLSESEAARVRRDLRQGIRDMQVWADEAAETLAGLAGNVAVVSAPRAAQARVKRVELVQIQETWALLVLVLHEAKTRQRILQLASLMAQDELTTLSNKLSALYGGATCHGIAAQEAELTALEQQLAHAVQEMLLDEESGRHEEPSVHGLRHLLGQPEFADQSKVGVLVEMLEDRRFLREILTRLLASERTRVLIGGEIGPGELHECSVVLARYGEVGRLSGILAVIGPTRMPYQRSIASVRLMASAMTEVVWELA